MPMAICCGEPAGAGDADGAGEGWLCWDFCCAFCWAACCACWAACWAAAAAARCSALRRAAACLAAASWAATARLCCRRRADWVVASRTCEASTPGPSSRSLPFACLAEFALAAISELVADKPGAVAGQSSTTPDATAAAATVEPVTAIVIFLGLLCWAVLRRRGMRDKMSPWSGARRALGFHPGHCRAAGEAGGGAAAHRRDAGSGRRVARGSRHARRVLSAIHHAEESAVLMPELT